MSAMLSALLWLLVFVAGSMALAYQRVPLFLASAAYLALLVVYTLAGTGPYWLTLLFWLLFLAVAIPVNVPAVRRHYISRPLLEIFRKIMPEMSETEAAALEAGTVW